MTVQSVRAFEVICCKCDATILDKEWEKVAMSDWNVFEQLCPKCKEKPESERKASELRRWNYSMTIQGFYQSLEGKWCKWEEVEAFVKCQGLAKVTDQRQDELWKEFLGEGEGKSSEVCGLCGDSGTVSRSLLLTSRLTVAINDRPCICPNGRAIKARREAAKKEKRLRRFSAEKTSVEGGHCWIVVDLRTTETPGQEIIANGLTEVWAERIADLLEDCEDG